MSRVRVDSGLAVVLGALALLVGCAETSEVALHGGWQDAGEPLGSPCSLEEPCQPQWLCLEGVCSERPWPSAVEPAPRLEASEEGLETHRDGTMTVGQADVSEGDVIRDEFSVAEDVEEQPAGDAQETLDVDGDGWSVDIQLPVKDVGSLGEGDGSVSDNGRAPTPPSDSADGGDLGPSDESVEDAEEPEADTATPSPGPETVIFIVAADSWQTGVVPASLIPVEGQGWVTELESPDAGRFIGLQAMLGTPFGSPACGRYRPALWTLGGDGEFGSYPSWVSGEVLVMQGTTEPKLWMMAEPPELPKGPFRLGLLVEPPCASGEPQPALVSDTSETAAGTWLYAPNADGSVSFVPAEFFGVTGRWVLQALIEVPLD